MASENGQLSFDTVFDTEPGQAVEIAPGLVRVTAPNAGPYTFTGTNTFLIGAETVFVVDPGPDDDAHLAALRTAIGGREVAAVLITHTHRDHSGLARRLAAACGAPLWFGGPHRLSRPRHLFEVNTLAGACDWSLTPDRTLVEGDILETGTHRIRVLETPGHCANHLAFGLEGTDIMLSGDHVMGWNSTLVAVPDGSMADYLKSLDKLIAAPFTRYQPAHGGPIADGPAFARALKAHRQARNQQIVAAVGDGARGVGAVVSKLYPGVPAPIRRAAALTVTAHAEYLEQAGALRIGRLGNWLRLYPS